MTRFPRALVLRANLRSAALAAAVALPHAGCGNGGDDTGGVEPPPDVTGSYNSIVGGTTGCESDKEWVSWANGALIISGTPDELTFKFPLTAGMEFLGGVDSTGGYSFAGEVTYVHSGTEVEAVLDVLNTGRFTWNEEDSRWEAEGDFTIEVDDDEFTTNNCTVTAPVTLFEI